MDDTELHYLTYDPKEIWNEMITNYVEAGGDLLYPGDEKEMLLQSVLADIMQVFAGVDNALRMQTLRYAVGDYLDLIGESRGCDRIRASPAVAVVTITTNTTGKKTTLEAGTRMTHDGVLFYELTDEIVLNGYQSTVNVNVRAVEAGSAGNSLKSGMELSLAIPNAYINRIVCTVNASGGNESEEDEEYKERVRNYGLASVTTGPKQQYEAMAKSVSSEIADAKAVNLGPVSVGVYLILKNEENEESILQSVRERLNAENVRPLTDKVTVQKAEDVFYTLNVRYMSDNSSSVLSAISAAVQNYQDWQDRNIGLAFNPDRLMSALYQAGATRVIWESGSTFAGKEAISYTEIKNNQRCKGTITLASMTE